MSTQTNRHAHIATYTVWYYYINYSNNNCELNAFVYDVRCSREFSSVIRMRGKKFLALESHEYIIAQIRSYTNFFLDCSSSSDVG